MNSNAKHPDFNMHELILINSLETRLTFQSVFVNSSPPSAAQKRQWSGSALVQIMACRLFGATPLSKLMLGYYQLDT